MKKYNSLGELLIDYRILNKVSQSEFSFKINVDIRTVQRWEKNITLIKPEKEEEIVLETLIPYQVIRNLNAIVPIPTFYDFRIRKYSLNELSNELPELDWFKSKLNLTSDKVRKIDFDLDIKHIKRFIDTQKEEQSFVNEELIKEALLLLPELNLIITDDSGYYAGHSIVLPIKKEVYIKIRNKELSKSELKVEHLADYKNDDFANFFIYDFAADHNDDVSYLLSNFLRFFKVMDKKDYLISTCTNRHDSIKLSIDSGMKIIWQDEKKKDELGLETALRFAEGDYKKIFANV